MRLRSWLPLPLLFVILTGSFVYAAERDDYYHTGALAGSLKSAEPLSVYDADPQHPWNRLFAALYTRGSNIPNTAGGEPVRRLEGGDYIDFLAWGGSRYWSIAETTKRIDELLDEFLNGTNVAVFDDPVKRAVLLRDLWAAYDFYTEQNMRRSGTVETRRRRDAISKKLARCRRLLALPQEQVDELPDTYAAAVASGAFFKRQDFDANSDYLPHGLLTRPDSWVEIDFFQPNIHEDLYDRFITLHARAYRGRSYFRIFYRFPEGRPALTDYLSQLDREGVDWRQAAQIGFILLKKDAPQIPVGTEVALVQFMMTLNDDLQPTPTKIVEVIRQRTFRNVDGGSNPTTNTGVGMHVGEYTLKRRLLFDNLRKGGLQREPDDLPLYRIIFRPDAAPDWGTDGRKTLFQQCIDCHMTPKHDRTGVHSMPSIVNMGGFDVGAQLGIVHPLKPNEAGTRGKRTARWKAQHETYRRLLEHLDE
ncbi:MAG: hypothetical protein CMJ64_03780 [Planctomycetaceae bacterium]|nr:hypothetical protein [Planctomycetaceae bacterium]